MQSGACRCESLIAFCFADHRRRSSSQPHIHPCTLRRQIMCVPSPTLVSLSPPFFQINLSYARLPLSPSLALHFARSAMHSQSRREEWERKSTEGKAGKRERGRWLKLICILHQEESRDLHA